SSLYLLFLLFRFPLKKPTRHGSILSRESPADKKQKVERCSSTHDFDPTGLVQRCVVIQRDENGFGLTVSGDNPVFVQSVNGTLVTHSNHLEVVKLIKSGSYVALTVQGRPPGSPQIPLADSEVDLAAFGHMSPIMTSPHSPGTSGNAERITSPVLMGEENNIVHNQKVEILRKMLQKEQERLQSLQEEYSRSASSRLLREIQETKKHITQLQEQLSKATGCAQDGVLSSRSVAESLQVSEVEAESGDALSKLDYSSDSPSRPNSDIADVSIKDYCSKGVTAVHFSSFPSPTPDSPQDSQSSIGSPSSRVGPQIIGAEDDDFDTEQEQINGQCSCFQNIELLKSRPAHLAVLLHHVVSQFDPAALLCYLYSDLYKQTNAKETRRVFLEFYQFFLDRAANLKVPIPDEISVDLEKRRPELIPEELHRHYIQTMQDKVCPEVQRNLEDFRQKRSMGLTLAEGELTKLDAERVRDRNAVEKERACAEQIIAKIEERGKNGFILNLTSADSTIQYVILTYMKHLGVKAKEARNLEQKRGRIGFLPKIKVQLMLKLGLSNFGFHDFLAQFSGAAEEKLKHATATFCSNQPFALEVIKSRQKKDSRFQTFVQDAESNPLCRRLQLKDIIPTEMQRLTKYPLLLDNIAKYTELPEEKEKVKKAADHCRQVLNHVNQAVKESENKQHLEDYQRRLDLSYLKQSEDPMMDEFRNLDLTKRKMLHEGPLTWKVNRDKTIDLYTLLLEDILVLLQKQDDKLVLKCHSKILASTADSKHTFSPIIKLNTVLVRQVATDNKAFFVISMSENGAHIYELVAQTVSEKNVWQDLIAQMAGNVKMESSRRVIPLPQSGPDKDLGLDSPLILNAQTSPTMSEKSEVESLLVAERQFDKVQQADLALKESSPCYEHTATNLPLVSGGQWALDALRNLDLLKKLLVQQLGFAEKGTLEDRQRFPRFRTVSQEAQTESGSELGLQHSNHNKFHQPGADPTLPRSGTNEPTANYDLRTSAESPTPGDAMQLGARDPRPSSNLAMDRMGVSLEVSATELEGVGADESGEHFFDAREAHSDENPSESELMERKDEEDVQIRISGNYLILDGYEAVQESSTDEEVSSLVLQGAAGGHTSLDSAQQQPLSPRDTQSDGGSSPFAEEMMVSRWGGVEEPCTVVANPPFWSIESRVQMMQYIQKIENDLEKLKEVEEDYIILRRQGLAGSASTGEHSGMTFWNRQCKAH
uniref:Rho guanine nucleotide exchange factor 12 n=1 Tax=Chrysolophus pictus TaxID=9089 RepID=A0A8C3PWK5_CHRPC